MAARTRTRPDIPSRSPIWVAETEILGPQSLPPRCLSRKLVRTQTRHSHMPQCCPKECIYFFIWKQWHTREGGGIFHHWLTPQIATSRLPQGLCHPLLLPLAARTQIVALLWNAGVCKGWFNLVSCDACSYYLPLIPPPQRHCLFLLWTVLCIPWCISVNKKSHCSSRMAVPHNSFFLPL